MKRTGYSWGRRMKIGQYSIVTLVKKSTDGLWERDGILLPIFSVEFPKAYKGITVIFFGYAFGVGWKKAA